MGKGQLMRIVILGAGILGLATAVELASHRSEQHLDINVVDPAPMSGATYHAGGMLAPTAEMIYQQDSLFPLMQTSAQWYPELIKTVTEHTSLPIGYRDDGTLVVAADRADAQHLRDVMHYQHAYGMNVERLPLSKARQIEPALHPHLAGVASIPGDHQIAPRIFAAALYDAAINLGVTFHSLAATHLRVSDSAKDDAPVHVHTTGPTFPADQVVVANGLGASTLSGWHPSATQESSPLKLRPVYGDIVRVRVPTYLQPFTHKVIRGFVEGRPIYIIPRDDGTIALGATTREDSRPAPHLGGVHDLLRDAIRIAPGLEDCDFIEATAGTRPGTPDDLPYLGRVNDHVVMSTGYFRHGILLAALGARVSRELVLGQPLSADIRACCPLRHLVNG